MSQPTKNTVPSIVLGILAIALIVITYFAFTEITGMRESDSSDKQEIKNETKEDHVSPQFKNGFSAGVKYGIISYMQHYEQNAINWHINEAQKWYWLIVVDDGKTLISNALVKTKTDKEIRE